MLRVVLAILLAAAAFAGLPGDAAAQCAMCKATLESSIEGPRVAAGMNRGILVMIAAPYLIFGSFLAALFRARIADWLSTSGTALRIRATRLVRPLSG